MARERMACTNDACGRSPTWAGLRRGVETNIGDSGLELTSGVPQSGDPDEHVAGGLVGVHRDVGDAVA